MDLFFIYILCFCFQFLIIHTHYFSLVIWAILILLYIQELSRRGENELIFTYIYCVYFLFLNSKAFSLSLQNEDGGFATYELKRSYNWLEVLLSHHLAYSH